MKLNSLLTKLGIKHDDIKLYEMAFTHKSYANENRDSKDYQRIEFFGDAIIDFIVSEYMYKEFKDMPEGKMSIIRAASVNKAKLTEFALELELEKYIKYGNNTKDFNNNTKIISDVFEALVGAIYLDKGIDEVRKFLNNNVIKFVGESKNTDSKNPKTTLQEFLQLESRGSIEYITTKVGNEFEAVVMHDGNKYGTGNGKTKKEAEVQAATNALELVGKGK